MASRKSQHYDDDDFDDGYDDDEWWDEDDDAPVAPKKVNARLAAVTRASHRAARPPARPPSPSLLACSAAGAQGRQTQGCRAIVGCE